MGKKVEDGVGLKGIEHIPADGAKAEEVFVSLINFLHGAVPP
jgi:hypothetical protein